ncbi:YGGT family protein [Tepidamorphus gemmatus]|uniref:YGGT family protein n=1 Tax=Tepidamorphus gemmatus TaxID=747076 RepID=A0A4R3MBN5_9HYPH|nr:YGGT family protein [Tepidamorphus gemmatus]
MEPQLSWVVQIPNYVLAALMYTLLARFVLSFLFAPDSPNYIFRAFVRLTDPVLAVVRVITPAAVPPLILLIFAAIWMLFLRIVLVVAVVGAAQA